MMASRASVATTQSLGMLLFVILQLSTMVVVMLLLLAGDVERNPGPLTVLTEKDVGPLVEKLANYASKWQDIGSQLGFTVPELENIMAYLPGQRPIVYLRLMLNEWVHWTPETSHGKHATLQDLESALRSNAVNLGTVADKLQAVFQAKGQSTESISPPQRKRKRTDSDLDPCMMTPIQRYAVYLKGVYKSAKTSTDKLPHLSCSKFINLALVKKERVSRLSADEFTKATLHGHVDEILKKKEPIKLEEVLKPTEGQPDMKCIFLEGAPGTGKSTCVWELCRRWDKVDALKKYSLVVLVRLREKLVQGAKKVYDLCFHESVDLRQAVAAEIEGRALYSRWL